MDIATARTLKKFTFCEIAMNFIKMRRHTKFRSTVYARNIIRQAIKDDSVGARRRANVARQPSPQRVTDKRYVGGSLRVGFAGNRSIKFSSKICLNSS